MRTEIKMSRCYCCGVKLTDTEMTKKNPDGSYNDMCNTCLDLSNTANKPKDYGHEYQHEYLTAGRTRFFRTPK